MDNIRKGSNAFKKNSTRRAAKRLIMKTVSPRYFDELWNYRNKNGNYSLWKDGTFSGFAFVNKRKNPRHWKIDLIGANKGQGRRILNEIKQDAVKAGVQFLNLNSVDTSTGFYVKHGFTKNFIRNRCTRMHCSIQRNKTLTMKLRSSGGIK
jgi:hypothetical protein